MEKVYIDTVEWQILYEPNENTVEMDIPREDVEAIDSKDIEDYIKTQLDFIMNNK